MDFILPCNVVMGNHYFWKLFATISGTSLMNLFANPDEPVVQWNQE